MRLKDIFATANHNLGRSRLRTFLTLLSIIIGAFTLSLSIGLGEGVKAYINSQIGSFSDANLYRVAKEGADAPSGGATFSSPEPKEYDPNAKQAATDFTQQFLSKEQIEQIDEFILRYEYALQCHGILIPLRRIILDSDLLRNLSDICRIEISCGNDDTLGIRIHFCFLAAFDTCDIQRAFLIGDDKRIGIESHLPTIEQCEPFSILGESDGNIAPDLVRIESMHRLAHIEHDIIRQIHDETDGSLADCEQRALEPFGRSAIPDSRNHARSEKRNFFGIRNSHAWHNQFRIRARRIRDDG